MSSRNECSAAGFTLVEIVVSIVLMGFLGAMALSGMVYVVQIYQAATAQTLRLPQIDAAHQFVVNKLRKSVDLSEPGKFVYQAGTRTLSYGSGLNAIALLDDVDSFSITEYSTANARIGSSTGLTAATKADKDTAADNYYCYRVRMTATVSTGRTIEYDTYVTPDTGTLLYHWGKEVLL